MPPRMKEKFNAEVTPKVAKQFDVKNVYALPKLQKIVLNVGMGKELEGTKVKPEVKDQVVKDLTVISGQKPVVISARKDVSNFKVRSGMETHVKVTLRGARMWEFFDRFISVACPRIKDFRGLSDKSFDKAGNYSVGITEQGIFPEINMAEAKYTHGMNINFVFTNSDPAKTRFLLAEMGVPFKKPEERQPKKTA
jgi:large subunit ribosomal protein L5